MSETTVGIKQEEALNEAYEMFREAKSLEQDLRWEKIAAKRGKSDGAKEKEIIERISFLAEYIFNVAKDVAYTQDELDAMSTLDMLGTSRKQSKAKEYVERVLEINEGLVTKEEETKKENETMSEAVPAKRVSKPRYITFADFETTGVDYKNSKMLEGSFVTTDITGDIISRFNILIKYTVSEVDQMEAEGDDWIRKTHGESGLFDDLRRAEGAVTIEEADRLLCDHLESLGLETKPMLGGDSPHFDRRFIERDLPVFHDMLSHQNIDCTSILYFLKSAGIKVPFLKNNNAHRAEDDILMSIEKYKMMQGLVVGVTKTGRKEANDLQEIKSVVKSMEGAGL